MKIGLQVYVRNSMEAVEIYCKAFDAEISCELSVGGQLFSAVSEAVRDPFAKS